MRQLFWPVVCLVTSLSCPVIAQTDERPKFEVASIKPSAPDAGGTFIRMYPGGRVNITNMSLKELIVNAWHIQPDQVSGGPAWLDSARYDISAKSESSPKEDEIPLMLRSLLADRFQLTIHRGTKDLPIYTLVVAKKDGKLGPGLTQSKEGSCTPYDPSEPPTPPGSPAVVCGTMISNPTRTTAASVPVDRLVAMLTRTLGRTVIDKTGLAGNFDITIEWSPDAEPGVPQASGGRGNALPTGEFSRPSIFTVIQEQLGLKLESPKGSVEILVIDRAEKPSEN